MDRHRAHAVVHDLLSAAIGNRSRWSELHEQLRPRASDYPRVFVGPAAGPAAEAYDWIWESKGFNLPMADARAVQVTVLASEEIRSWTAQSQQALSAEWKEAAAHLADGLWVAVASFSAADGTEVGRAEGLVLVDEALRWFPSPSAALGDLPAPDRPAPALPPDAVRFHDAGPSPAGAPPPNLPTPPPAAAPSPAAPKEAATIRWDLDAVALEPERSLFGALMADARIIEAVKAVDLPTARAKVRFALLAAAVRLTRSMAPDLHALAEELCAKLGLSHEVEIYCNKETSLNATVFTEGNRIIITLTARAWEQLTESDLKFVVGHELAHVVLGHSDLDGRFVVKRELPATLVRQVFAWQRYAEMAADRFGLLAAGSLEASAKILFKLHCGVTDERLAETALRYVDQLGPLDELLSGDVPEETWFEVHPYGPLRLKALQLWSESATCRRMLGARDGKGMSPTAVRDAVARLADRMNPIEAKTPVRHEVARFLALAAALVAAADGVIDPAETSATADIVADDLARESRDLVASDWNGARQRLSDLGATLSKSLDGVERLKLLEDVAAVAWANRRVLEERAALHGCAAALGLPWRAADDALARCARPLD